ncbi:hypothetical protein LBMAG47_28440 [Planctomycetia bacterium]|nr:hypothetical protein LBMAG47_28440 [Planctomycetia bacterium]
MMTRRSCESADGVWGARSLCGMSSRPTNQAILGGGQNSASADMKTLQEIEKAVELLPRAEQLRLYRDLPHLIGRDSEDLEWQRLAIEEFFRDVSPDDAVHDNL